MYVRSCGFGYRLAIYLGPCRLAYRLVGRYTYTEPPSIGPHASNLYLNFSKQLRKMTSQVQ